MHSMASVERILSPLRRASGYAGVRDRPRQFRRLSALPRAKEIGRRVSVAEPGATRCMTSR